MSKLQQAKEEGCLHCLKSTDFIKFINEDNEEVWECTKCGCQHAEMWYMFGCPNDDLKPKEVIQRSYRENEILEEERLATQTK